MEGISRIKRSHVASSSGPTGKERRYGTTEEDGGDGVDCSGKRWRSCSGGVVADCVALCCCPCAVVNLLTLALVKVPWKVGKRCLGFGKKRNGAVLVERKAELAVAGGAMWEFQSGEAGKVWSELLEIGEVGFGRVGIQCHQLQGKDI